MTQKPSGIGRLDAYSCPCITVSDISNIPNASSLPLVCAHIAIAVGVLWFYLKPGRFQAQQFSRKILGTRDLRCLTHHKQFMIINRVWEVEHTFSFPAPYVIVSDITHALQTATVCMLAHVSSLWTISDYGVYHKRLCFTNHVCRNDLHNIILL